jgi:hypothetical protein
MGLTNADETYNENIAKGMNEKEALIRAVTSGAIEGGSEYLLGGETVSKVIKGQWKELLAKGGKEAAEEAMKKTLGHKAWDFVKNEILAEAGQEAGTEVAHDVADTVLNGTFNGQWNDGRTLKEDVSNALWAGYGGGLMGAVGGGTRTVLNVAGLGQAEMLQDNGNTAVIQTETGETAEVRKTFLQNAEMQEVPVNPAPMEQQRAMETKPAEEDKVATAVTNMSNAKQEHEAGKVETKDYLDNIAKENYVIDTEQDSNVNVKDEIIFTDRKSRVNGGTIIKDHGNGLYEVETQGNNGLEYALVKHDGKGFKSVYSSPTSTEQLPIEDRTFENVGNRKVKSYQYLHPELKSFIQDEATILLGELEATLPAQR